MTEFSEYMYPEQASRYLGNHLYKGSLVLFLGAGASSGFGLPDWVELINRLRAQVGFEPVSKKATADELQQYASEVERGYNSDKDFIVAIQKALYNGSEELTKNVLNKNLLVAISTLLIGSKRGRISRVITLNYDNVLEWFLHLFGFVVKSVRDLPTLEGSEDVRIYHPHGFIPHPKSKDCLSSEFVILTFKSANKRLGTIGDPWFEFVRNVLLSGVSLFIGMSPRTLSDRLLAPLLTTVGGQIKAARFLGFWLVDHKLEDAKINEFKESNVVPLIMARDDIPDFLLTISQAAAKKIK